MSKGTSKQSKGVGRGKGGGPKTPRGKRRSSSNALKHGLYAGGLYAGFLSRRGITTEAEVTAAATTDLTHELALLRALIADALEWTASTPKAQASAMAAIADALSKLGRLAEIQAKKAGAGANFGVINNLQVNLAALSTEQLKAALRALETPELRPLAALLLPVLQQAQAGQLEEGNK